MLINLRIAFEVVFALRYDGVSKSFRTGHLERELQMVQLSATRCRCIAILWVRLVSFAAITFRVASQRVFIVVVVVVVYFVIDSVRKLLDTPLYVWHHIYSQNSWIEYMDTKRGECRKTIRRLIICNKYCYGDQLKVTWAGHVARMDGIRNTYILTSYVFDLLQK
jgi:uncharacterized membrane protein